MRNFLHILLTVLYYLTVSAREFSCNSLKNIGNSYQNQKWHQIPYLFDGVRNQENIKYCCKKLGIHQLPYIDAVYLNQLCKEYESQNKNTQDSNTFAYQKRNLLNSTNQTSSNGSFQNQSNGSSFQDFKNKNYSNNNSNISSTNEIGKNNSEILHSSSSSIQLNNQQEFNVSQQSSPSIDNSTNNLSILNQNSNLLIDFLYNLLLIILVLVFILAIVLAIKVILKYWNESKNKPPNIYDQMMSEMKKENDVGIKKGPFYAKIDFEQNNENQEDIINLNLNQQDPSIFINEIQNDTLRSDQNNKSDSF